MSHPVERRWYPITFAIAALVLLPLSILLFSWSSVDTEIWAHLWDTQMPRLLGNTLTLVLGVSVGVVVLGVSLHAPACLLQLLDIGSPLQAAAIAVRRTTKFRNNDSVRKCWKPLRGTA